MKIEIDEEERKELLKSILKDLTEVDQNGMTEKWKGGFRTNPIQREFSNVMRKVLVEEMNKLLDDEIFRSKLAEIGKVFMQKLLQKKTTDITEKMLDTILSGYL